MAKKNQNKSTGKGKYIIGAIIVAFMLVGILTYISQPVTIPSIRVTPPVGTAIQTPHTTYATPPPTPPPTPKITQATPAPTATSPTVTEATPPATGQATATATSTYTVCQYNPNYLAGDSRCVPGGTATATPGSTGTISYQSVQWSLSTGGTSTATITFQIFGTWSGTVKAQVKKDISWATDTVIGETDQYVSGTSTIKTVTVSFPNIGQTANAGDWVFIRVEGIYDEGGVIGGTTARKAVGTEVQMPTYGGGGGGARTGTPTPTATPSGGGGGTIQAQFKVVDVKWSTSSNDPNPQPVLSVPVGTRVHFYATIQTLSPGMVDPDLIKVEIKKDVIDYDDWSLDASTGQWVEVLSSNPYNKELSYAFSALPPLTPFYLDGTANVYVASFIPNEATKGWLREYYARGYVYTAGSGYTISTLTYDPTNPSTRSRVTTQ